MCSTDGTDPATNDATDEHANANCHNHSLGCVALQIDHLLSSKGKLGSWDFYSEILEEHPSRTSEKC